MSPTEMMTRSSRWLLPFCLAVSCTVMPAMAAPQQQKSQPEQQKAQPAAPAAQPDAAAKDGAKDGTKAVAPKAELLGFRSARFGMTEDEVRAAIVKDFAVKPDAIQVEEDLVDRTRVLVVKVPDVLPKGGIAQISYTLGYNTKKLIYVNVVWSPAWDSTVTPEMLVANAKVLGAYFQGAGYRPDSVKINLQLNTTTIVVFSGLDEQNRMVQMTLLGGPSGDDKSGFKAGQLQVFYVMDPTNLDVFRIQPGQF